MKCMLNVKQMVLAYRSATTEDEADALWDAFLTLRAHHFITDEEWDRFFDITNRNWRSEDPTMEV